MYKLLANIVVVIHVTFVIWVLIGGFLARKYKIATAFQLGCLVYAILITWYGFPCPLTDIEKLFLSRAGEQVYEGEFLPHYLWSLFNIGQSTVLAIVILVLLISLNVVAYFPLIKVRILRYKNK